MFQTEMELTTNELESLTLSQIVNRNYKTAAVFEKHKLDFCCKGKRSVGEACNEAGLNNEEVISDLKNILTESSAPAMSPDAWGLDFLIDYILNAHHTYVKGMLPIIDAHMNRVLSKHGKNHPEIRELAKIFSILEKDLRQHMMKEEEILFPYIKRLTAVKEKNSKYEPPYFGSVRNPIAMMEAEHSSAGNDFEEIKNITDSYSLPEDACNGFRILYLELREFEEDLHKHIHLENNILFPKSIELESEFRLD